MRKTDGGPAFPIANTNDIPEEYRGMTLRDYAEVQFIAALLSNSALPDELSAKELIQAGKTAADLWLEARDDSA